jgi:hypothetical protein
MMITVFRMVTMFIMSVKIKYFEMSGMTIEVGGRILETRSKKTTKASKIEMHSVIFSPSSVGK